MPAAGVEGTIRIWGHGHRGQDYILTLLRAWQDAFLQNHPDTVFADELTGNASGLAGLYTGAADLALLDREASFIELDAYRQGLGYEAFRIAVAQGSVATPHHAPALKIFVNRRNPLASLTLQQVDAIFDADHRGGDHALATWGDLGLAGAWAGKPIHRYTYEIQSSAVQFFERAAMKGSQKFVCCLTLFPSATAERNIAAGVARDPYGLALATMPMPALKPVPLAGVGAPVLATSASITAGLYPLARTVYLYANRVPKTPLPPNVSAFLAFVVSPEGQAIASRTGGYLPLSVSAAVQAREALK